jgi:hypothetical protein
MILSDVYLFIFIDVTTCDYFIFLLLLVNCDYYIAKCCVCFFGLYSPEYIGVVNPTNHISEFFLLHLIL